MLTFQGGIRVPSYTASKIGHRRADQAARQRMGGQGHQRQRDRAGLYRDQQHRRAAGRRGAQQVDPRPHPGGALGRCERPGRRGGVPRQPRVGLCPGPYPRGRWRLAGALMGTIPRLRRDHARGCRRPGRELLLQTPKLDVWVAGAEANVATALARLGHDVGFASAVPDNDLGRAAIADLARARRRYVAASSCGGERHGAVFRHLGRRDARDRSDLRPRAFGVRRSAAPRRGTGTRCSTGSTGCICRGSRPRSARCPRRARSPRPKRRRRAASRSRSTAIGAANCGSAGTATRAAILTESSRMPT